MPESNKQIRPVLSVLIAVKADIDSELVGLGLTALSVSGDTGGERKRLELALAELTQQDSTLKVVPEPSDGKIKLLGISETHLESICERIWNEYKIEIEVGEPQVLYLETIRKDADAEGKYIRQTGGQGNYGHCKIHLTPSLPHTEYKFVNEITGDAIPKEFIEPIEQGIREAMNSGILAGCPIVNVTVTLYDGSYHETDSNEIAYRIAGAMAFKEAARKANPLLLEPVMAVYTRIEEKYSGSIIADLNNRRGRIESIESRDGSKVIQAMVPLSEMLTSSERGRADYPMHFSHYEPAFRGGETGENEAGVTANKPNAPTAGSRSAAVRPEEQFESSNAVGRLRERRGSEPSSNLAGS